MAKPKKPKPKPKPPKYSWILSPQGVSCFPDAAGGQTLLPLWEAATLTRFHDQACASATREINAILDRVQAAKANEEVELSFITFQDRLFLVWSRYDVVGPHDEDDDVAEALGLKASTPEQSRKQGA